MSFLCQSCSSTTGSRFDSNMCGMCGHDNRADNCECPNCVEYGEFLTEPFFFVFDQYLNSHDEFTRGLCLLDELCAKLDATVIEAARPKLRARGFVRVDDYIAGILRERMNMVRQPELLRIGIGGGRALIEQPRKSKPCKDTRTIDMFDQQPELFA